jgi:hypothetical protein
MKSLKDRAKERSDATAAQARSAQEKAARQARILHDLQADVEQFGSQLGVQTTSHANTLTIRTQARGDLSIKVEMDVDNNPTFVVGGNPQRKVDEDGLLDAMLDFLKAP